MAAADRTTQAFGMAGKAAGEDQILGLYNAFKQIETLREESAARVKSVIGKELGRETKKDVISDLTFAMKNVGLVIREFLGVVRGR